MRVCGGLEVVFVSDCSWLTLVTGMGGYVLAGVEIGGLSYIFLYFGGRESGEWVCACIRAFTHTNDVHQEITLVYICQIRMRLYVIKSLNDIYMSNNF